MYTTNELLSVYTDDIVQLKETIAILQERNDRLYTDLECLRNELAEYQRIYGSLDQGDYLRR